jgi:hypothetical protein
MLGSLTEADDAVQDTWLRFSPAAPAQRKPGPGGVRHARRASVAQGGVGQPAGLRTRARLRESRDSISGGLRGVLDVLECVLEADHIGVLLVHVEQVDRVRRFVAIEYALFDDLDAQAIARRVDHRGAHAAAGALAGDDQRVDAEPVAGLARTCGAVSRQSERRLTNPKLLVMDEPTEGLAPLIVRELEETLRTLKSSGASILLAEQRFGFALSVADRAYILAHGRTVAEGAPAELWDNQAIKHTYLGV